MWLWKCSPQAAALLTQGGQARCERGRGTHGSASLAPVLTLIHQPCQGDRGEKLRESTAPRGGGGDEHTIRNLPGHAPMATPASPAISSSTQKKAEITAVK